MLYNTGLVVCFLTPRPPAQVKRPNTGVKAQRKDCPGVQPQHRGAAGKNQPNVRSDKLTGRENARKVKEEKVSVRKKKEWWEGGKWKSLSSYAVYYGPWLRKWSNIQNCNISRHNKNCGAYSEEHINPQCVCFYFFVLFRVRTPRRGQERVSWENSTTQVTTATWLIFWSETSCQEILISTGKHRGGLKTNKKLFEQFYTALLLVISE